MMLCFFFFFFKQKTAYEMHISDWSSDVCSSDLMFPDSFAQALTMNQQVQAARSRMDNAKAAFQQTMTVQAQVAENVQADAQTLATIVARSQGAEGALQVGQATNQLLALAAKQRFQIQNLMAAQYRAQALEQARRAPSERSEQHTPELQSLIS